MSQIDIEILRQKVGDRINELAELVDQTYGTLDYARKYHVFYVADPAYYVGGERERQSDQVWETLQALQSDRVRVDCIFPPVDDSCLSTNVQFIRGRTVLAVVGDFNRLDESMRDALGMALTSAAAAHPSYKVDDLIFKDNEFYKE